MSLHLPLLVVLTVVSGFEAIPPGHAPWFDVDIASGRIDYNPIQTTWVTFPGNATGATNIVLADKDLYSPGANGNVSSMSVWFKLEGGWTGVHRYIVRKRAAGNDEYDLLVTSGLELKFRQFALDS